MYRHSLLWTTIIVFAFSLCSQSEGFLLPISKLQQPIGRQRPRQSATTLHNQESYAPSQVNHGGGPSDEWREKGSMQQMLFASDNRAVILFDGICSFCDFGVNMFLNYDGDPRGSFRFASLQGEIGQGLLKEHGLDQEHFNTIIVVEADQLYTKSDAVLRIAKDLRDPFPALATVAVFLPRELRDTIYEWVSENRHVFGEKDSCRIPSESEMDRFLD